MSSNIEVVNLDLLSLKNNFSEENTFSMTDEDTGVTYTLVAVAKS